MKPALLVIDVQKDMYGVRPTTTQSLNEAVEYINAALELFRAKCLPVVCIQHMDEKENLIPGQPGFDLPEDLKILPSDLHITKTHNNSFTKTDLHALLQAQHVDTLILTGYAAEHCVLSTFIGARDLDYTPILLRNAIAGDVPENIRFVESICNVISYGALKKVLE